MHKIVLNIWQRLCFMSFVLILASPMGCQNEEHNNINLDSISGVKEIKIEELALGGTSAYSDILRLLLPEKEFDQFVDQISSEGFDLENLNGLALELNRLIEWSFRYPAQIYFEGFFVDYDNYKDSTLTRQLKLKVSISRNDFFPLFYRKLNSTRFFNPKL